VSARILVIAEHDGKKLNPSTAKCVSCARALAGAEITVVVLAPDAAAVAAQARSTLYSPAGTFDDLRQGPDGTRRGAAASAAGE